MKKTGLLVMALLLSLNLVGCSSSDSSPKAEERSTTEPAVAETAASQVEENTTGEEAKASGEPSWEVGEGKATTWTDSIGSNWVQIMVPVTNTGDDNLYLSSGTIDLEDSEGHLVDSRTMVPVYPEVLMPGETAYYYEETTLDEGTDSELTVVPHVKADKANLDCVRFEVSDLELKNEQYGGVVLTGRVENTSTEAESMVYITAFLYDSNNEMIASMFTILTDELAAGDKIGFSANTFSAPDSVTAEAVDHYDVFAYPMQMQF